MFVFVSMFFLSIVIFHVNCHPCVAPNKPSLRSMAERAAQRAIAILTAADKAAQKRTRRQETQRKYFRNNAKKVQRASLQRRKIKRITDGVDRLERTLGDWRKFLVEKEMQDREEAEREALLETARVQKTLARARRIASQYETDDDETDSDATSSEDEEEQLTGAKKRKKVKITDDTTAKRSKQVHEEVTSASAQPPPIPPPTTIEPIPRQAAPLLSELSRQSIDSMSLAELETLLLQRRGNPQAAPSKSAPVAQASVRVTARDALLPLVVVLTYSHDAISQYLDELVLTFLSSIFLLVVQEQQTPVVTPPPLQSASASAPTNSASSVSESSRQAKPEKAALENASADPAPRASDG